MSFDVIRSRVFPLLIDHVDTDQIIPARFLKTVDRTGLGEHLFADWRERGDVDGSLFGVASVLVAGDNFGCGSSREHAPWSLLGAGFRAVIARSFADIFRANALRNGLLPVALGPADHGDLVRAIGEDPTIEVEVDLEAQVLRAAGKVVRFEVDPFWRDCLLRGIDSLEYVLERSGDIERFEARHG